MALQRKVKNLKDVPEDMHQHYVKKGDHFVLDLEVGDNDDGGEETDPAVKKKLKEFRDNNTKLNKENDDLKKKLEAFEGVDPDTMKDALEAKKQVDELEDKELLNKGKLEDVVQKRVDAARKGYEDQIGKLQRQVKEKSDEYGKLSDTYRKVRLRNDVISTANKIASLRPGADFDLVSRAERVFQLDNSDQFVTEDADDKGNPYSLDTWVQSQMKDSPHLFEPSQGSGASGGTKKVAQPGKKVLAKSDAAGFVNNLDAIINGSVQVAGFEGE